MDEKNQQTEQMGSGSSGAGAAPSGENSAKENNTESSRQASQELLDELGRLGAKFAEVMQTAWESDERKQLQKEAKAGIVSLVNGLERGLRNLSEREHTKEFIDKAEDVAESVGERVRNSRTGNELASGLVKGLQILAEQIDKLAEELQRRSSATADKAAIPKDATTDASQEIPIEKV